MRIEQVFKEGIYSVHVYVFNLLVLVVVLPLHYNFLWKYVFIYLFFLFRPPNPFFGKSLEKQLIKKIWPYCEKIVAND